MTTNDKPTTSTSVTNKDKVKKDLPELTSRKFNDFCFEAFGQLNHLTPQADGDASNLSEYDRGVCAGLMKSTLAGLIPFATIADVDVVMSDGGDGWLDIEFTYVKGNRTVSSANIKEFFGAEIT